MTRLARKCSKARLMKDAMIQIENIYFETSKGMSVVGSIDPAHLPKTSRLTAVKVSIP